MKSSFDWIEFVDDHIVCKVCGARVERGIVNVTGHWTKCQGKETMDSVNKIENLRSTQMIKINLIKQLFNIEQ